MSDARWLALALLVSLCLHGGIASVLRALGSGRPTDDPGVLALYVDLVEPVVVVSDAPSRPALRPAPAPARAAPRVETGTFPRGEAPARASVPARPPERTAASSPTGAEREVPPASSESAPPAAPVASPPAPRASPARVPDVDLGSPRPVQTRTVVDDPARNPAPGPARPADPVIAEGTRAEDLGQRRESGGGGPEARRIAPGSVALGARAGTSGPETGTIRPGAGVTARGAGTADAGAGGVREEAPAAGPGRTGGEVAALPGGRGGAVPPEYDGYVRGLRQRIQERLVYPWLAVRRGLSGVIELEVRLDTGGRLLSVDAAGPEGPRLLRDAATQAVREATPFPFPSGLTPRPLTIRLPVVFELK